MQVSVVFFFLSCIVSVCSVISPAAFMSLSSSSLNGYFPLPHIAIFSLALTSSSQCLSLWPTKVKSHHVFPSCSPPTMRWSSEPPTGGIKHMIYRAPSKTKKGKRKKMKDQFSSSVVLGFSAVVILQVWLEMSKTWKSDHTMRCDESQIVRIDKNDRECVNCKNND